MKALLTLMLLGGTILAGFKIAPFIPDDCLPHQEYSLSSCVDGLRGNIAETVDTSPVEDGSTPPSDVRTAAFPGVVDIEISGGFLCSEHSHGTGFIMDAGGRIGTAKHVVASFGSICGWSVVLEDGRTLSGQVVWEHPSLDLAEIKLDKADNLKPLSMGSSSAVRTGEGIYTVSYVGGTQNPPVLSAGTLIGRRPCNEAQDGLWFDADVLQGYSGGPLLDAAGEVIGVVTSSLSAFEEGEGSCAVPVEYLAR